MKQIELELSFQATYLTGWGLRGAWKRGRVQSNILTATWNSWPETLMIVRIPISFSLAMILHTTWIKAELKRQQSSLMRQAYGMFPRTHFCTMCLTPTYL